MKTSAVGELIGVKRRDTNCKEKASCITIIKEGAKPWCKNIQFLEVASSAGQTSLRTTSTGSFLVHSASIKYVDVRTLRNVCIYFMNPPMAAGVLYLI
ncbi:hypothetical protein M0804_001332 [Polistes exclamans]|nr:hypothetical protein M0804_001332 [Polistes exclamans]